MRQKRKIPKNIRTAITTFLGRGRYTTRDGKVTSLWDTLWVEGEPVARWEGNRLHVSGSTKESAVPILAYLQDTINAGGEFHHFRAYLQDKQP